MYKRQIFFRDQKINAEQHIALAEKFGPLETHAYVKGLSKHPEIVRIIKAEDEKTNGVRIGIVMLVIMKNQRKQ